MPPKRRKPQPAATPAAKRPRRPTSPRPKREIPTPVATPAAAVEAPTPKSTSTGRSRKTLMNGYGSSSSGSSSSSSEDEKTVATAGTQAGGSDDDDEDEEEEDWEDVLQAVAPVAPSSAAVSKETGDLELTLDREAAAAGAFASNAKKRGASLEERRIRFYTHCLHVQFLMFHGAIRNKWCNDETVQGILLSQVPPGVMKDIERVKAKEEKKKQKGKGKAGDGSVSDPWVKTLGTVMHWWKKKFTVDAPGMRKNGYKPMSQFVTEKNEEGRKLRFTTGNKDKDGEEVFIVFKHQGETVEGIEGFRKLAEECRGSRDTGAVLFTALLRALGLQARIVFSLQPLGFGFSGAENAVSAEEQTAASPKKPVPIKKGRKRKREDPSSSEEGSLSEEDTEDGGGFVREKPLRKAKPKIDADLPYPVFWTEVRSPSTETWIAVDSLVLTVLGSTPDLFAKFEPKGKKATEAKQIIAYVLAYSADGTAKDVTVRYLAKHVFPGKTKGVRMLPYEQPLYYDGQIVATHTVDWFDNAMRGYRKPEDQRAELDHAEDEELKPVIIVKERKKANTESISGYKNHPDYLLERHLKRDEAVKPGKSHVKSFTAPVKKKRNSKDEDSPLPAVEGVEEKVYRRKDIVTVKATETWWKEGRKIRPEEEPLKTVKRRAVTLARKRQIEDVKRDGGGAVMQGLYSLEQTELYIPPPIEDGFIPRNEFGNIDVYVKTMIPEGAVHIPLKGAGRVAKKLGVSFADAVTGFEFKRQRAVPFVEGVIVAKENEGLIRDAWNEEEKEKKRKEDGKREQAALDRWRRFLVKIRVLSRLREEWNDEGGTEEEVNPFVKRKDAMVDAGRDEDGGGGFVKDGEDDAGGFVREDEGAGGGFLPDGDDNDDVSGGGFVLDGDDDLYAPAPTKPKDAPVMSLADMVASKNGESALGDIEAEDQGNVSGGEGEGAEEEAEEEEVTSKYFRKPESLEPEQPAMKQEAVKKTPRRRGAKATTNSTIRKSTAKRTTTRKKKADTESDEDGGVEKIETKVVGRRSSRLAMVQTPTKAVAGGRRKSLYVEDDEEEADEQEE